MLLEDQGEIPLILDVEDVIVATVSDVPAYLDDMEAGDGSDGDGSDGEKHRRRRKPTKAPVDEDSDDSSSESSDNQSDSDAEPSKRKGKAVVRRFTAEEKGKGKAVLQAAGKGEGKGKGKAKDVSYAPGKGKGGEKARAKAKGRSKASVEEKVVKSFRNKNAEAGPSNLKAPIVPTASDDNVETGVSSAPRPSHRPVPVPVNKDSEMSTAGITVDPQILAAVMMALRVAGVNIPEGVPNGEKRDRQVYGDDDDDNDNVQGSSKKQRME